MNKKVLFWILAVVLLVATMNGVVADTLIMNETFESNSVANWTAGTGTVTIESSTPIYAGSYSLQSSMQLNDNNYWNADTFDYPNNNLSIKAWVYQEDANKRSWFALWEDDSNYIAFVTTTGGTYTAGIYEKDASPSFIDTSPVYSGGSGWYYWDITVKRYGANNEFVGRLYDNGLSLLATVQANSTLSFLDAPNSLTIGTSNGLGSLTDYWYDNIEVSETVGGVPPVVNFSVTAKNTYGVAINNFTAIVNGSSYSTTSGTAMTNINEDSGSVTVVVNDAIDSNGYFFNKTVYSIDTATNYIMTGLYQAQLNVDVFEAISNNSLFAPLRLNSSAQLIDGGYHTNDIYRITSQLWNIKVYNDSYFNKTVAFNVPNLFNGTYDIPDLYTGAINITVENAFSGQNLSNFSGYIYSYNETYNESFNSTDGDAEFNVIDGTYLFFVTAPNYSITGANFKNITILDEEENHTFQLWSNNSVRIYIYDEDTTFLITSNMTVTISGNESEDVYYTATGFLFVQDLSDGEYSVKLVGGNYSLKSYAVTVADSSTQELKTYLSSISEDVIFAFLDYDSSALLEGVSMTMSRQINSSWTVVQTKTSDITGRVLLQYVPGVQYKFLATKTGYDSKLFYLDPVIFTSYNIRMTKTTVITDAPGYADISLTYYPKTFSTNESNLFTWIIASPSGSLSTYNLSLLYPGGSDSYSGSNAIGEEFSFLFNISGASLLDYINVSYCFDTTIATQQCFVFRHLLYGQAGNNTIYGVNRDNTYGLDLFSRVIIATLIVLVVAGVLTMFSGALVGASIGIFLFALLTYMGFIPVWATLPGALVGLLLIFRRTE